MSLLDPIASLINEFDVGPLTLQRRGVPTINAYGEAVQGAATPVILRPVAVHVADMRSRNLLPEALRTRESIEVYTAGQRMYTGDGQSDVISYQGRNYVVSYVADYQTNGGVYFAIAVLEDEN